MTADTGIPRLPRAPIARALGALLDGAFAAIRLLRAPRPIHSRGVVYEGRIRWIPDAVPADVSWIDDAPTAAIPVVARLSRSISLPAPLPDVIGLALRVTHDGRPVDIELASTGWGIPSRFFLAMHRRAEHARFGTLLPYRGRRGAVLLGARTRSGRPRATDPRDLASATETSQDATAEWTLTLGHASAVGRWHPFGVVELTVSPDQDDAGLRFDAVRRPLPGTRAYAWVRAARQPSYERVQADGTPLRIP